MAGDLYCNDIPAKWKAMPNFMEKHQPQHIRVSVSEGAKLLGLSAHTIRQAIKAGELKYVIVRGRYKIALPSLIMWSQKNSWRKKKFEQQGIGQYVEKWRINHPLFSPNYKITRNNEPVNMLNTR